MAVSVLRDDTDLRRPEGGRPGEASVVATLSRRPEPGELAELDRMASGLEVRADLAGDLEPAWLRSHFSGTLTFSLPGSEARNGDRHPRLLAAADGYDMVELELAHDLDPELLRRIPPERRRVAWRGPAAGLSELARRFERMTSVPARRYLLATEARSVEDGLGPLRLLKALGRDDVTAFATGAPGAWTRLLAPRLGAAVVYGSAAEPEHAGVPTVDQLGADYGFPAIEPVEELFGMVGGSQRHSLAPRIMNTGFRRLGVPGLYLPFFPAALDAFLRGLADSGLPAIGLPLRGLTVVSPHKEDALAIAGERDREGASRRGREPARKHQRRLERREHLGCGRAARGRGIRPQWQGRRGRRLRRGWAIGRGGAEPARGCGHPRQPRRAARAIRERAARPALDPAGGVLRRRASTVVVNATPLATRGCVRPRRPFRLGSGRRPRLRRRGAKRRWSQPLGVANWSSSTGVRCSPGRPGRSSSG